jgi:hypothetical protein
MVIFMPCFSRLSQYDRRFQQSFVQHEHLVVGRERRQCMETELELRQRNGEPEHKQ